MGSIPSQHRCFISMFQSFPIISIIATSEMFMNICISGLDFLKNVITKSQTWDSVFDHPSG